MGLFVRSLLESLPLQPIIGAPPTLNRRFGALKVSLLRTHYHLHLHPLVSAPTLIAYLTSESNNTLDLYTLSAGRKGHADNQLSANRIATAEYSAPEAKRQPARYEYTFAGKLGMLHQSAEIRFFKSLETAHYHDWRVYSACDAIDG